jgi:hypothetical protein
VDIIAKSRGQGAPFPGTARTKATVALLIWACSVVAPHAWSHEGHGNDAAWHACESAQLGEHCAYTKSEMEYIGNCRLVQEDLLCVRNQPLKPAAALETASAFSPTAKGTAEMSSADRAVNSSSIVNKR